MDIQGSVILANMYFDFPIFMVMMLLILFSAFFSMSETAITSTPTSKLKLFIEERRSGAKKAMYCSEHYERTITTILIGNNIVNILLATLSVGFFGKLIINNNYIELISTAVTTITVLAFGEILPKTMGKQYSDAITLKISWAIYFLSIILYPLVFVFMQLQRLLTSKKSEKPSVDEDELEAILDTMEDEGAIEEGELSLIKNVFDLNDRSVEDIMVPRIEMVAISVDTETVEIVKILIDNQYSRIPVYDGDKDHIIGILYERDYLQMIVSGKTIPLREVIKPAIYVSASMKVDSLIHELQKKKTHMAIVSGEYGDTLGLVTMEDALEELVGEIYDEHDEAGTNDLVFTKVDDQTYIVDGEMYVDDLFRRLDVGTAPDDIPNKVTSWVYEKCESVPTLGYTFCYISIFAKYNEETDNYDDVYKKLTFTIDSLEERRIKTVKVFIEDATKEEVLDQEKNEEE